jgi:hypothetical protein
MLALICAAPAWAAQSGNIYKWTDSRGVVHYGDKVPPQGSRRQREVINPQGMVVSVLPAQKTSRQLASQNKRREAREDRRKQRQHDEMLLNAYRSVSDIKRARDSRINAIEATATITQNTIDTLKNRLKKPDGKHPDHSTKVEADSKKRAALKQQLADNQQALARERAEQERIKKAYAADIARFRVLRKKN